MPFNFGLITEPWTAPRLARRIAAHLDALPAGASPNWVLGKHDVRRLATRLGPARARVAAVLALTLQLRRAFAWVRDCSRRPESTAGGLAYYNEVGGRRYCVLAQIDEGAHTQQRCPSQARPPARPSSPARRTSGR